MRDIDTTTVTEIFDYTRNKDVILIQDATTLEIMWPPYTPPVPQADYFYVRNEYNGNNNVKFKINIYNSAPASGTFTTTVKYSKDGVNFDNMVVTDEITLQSGETVYFRNTNGKWSYYQEEPISGLAIVLTTTQACSVGGNMNSLLDYRDMNNVQLPQGCFAHFFDEAEHIQSVGTITLPATTLSDSCYSSMFCDVTAMTTAPVLPATTMQPYCYNNMFSGCTGLTSAPVLAATTLDTGCYNTMFAGCTALTTAPSLPATTLEDFCYGGMFRECSSLTSAPVLASTSLAEGCYGSMFFDCTSLVTPPSLPATTLASGCYGMMFRGCSSLTSAPVLAATTLQSYCYNGMFQDCTSLTTAPTLPATTLTPYCYMDMFKGCSNLNSMTVYANDISATACTYNWLQNVANSGTFNNEGSANYTRNSESGIPTGWIVPVNYTVIIQTPSYPYDGDFKVNGVLYTSTYTASVPSGTTLTLEAVPHLGYYFYGWGDGNSSTTRTLTVESDETLSPTFNDEYFYVQAPEQTSVLVEVETSGSGNYGNHATQFEYSLDRSSWTTVQIYSGNIFSINIQAGEKVFFRNNSGYFNYYDVDTGDYFVSTFNCSSYFSVGGNIYSLVNYNYMSDKYHALPKGSLACLFEESNLVDASELVLPSASYAAYNETNCYARMFYMCRWLQHTPVELPMDELYYSMYYQMFMYCSSITDSPAIKAETLGMYSCYQMFYGCWSLNSITVYADDISGYDCTNEWLESVAQTGTFHNLGSATYTTGSSSGIPSGWTEVNS